MFFQSLRIKVMVAWIGDEDFQAIFKMAPNFSERRRCDRSKIPKDIACYLSSIFAAENRKNAGSFTFPEQVVLS